MQSVNNRHQNRRLYQITIFHCDFTLFCVSRVQKCFAAQLHKNLQTQPVHIFKGVSDKRCGTKLQISVHLQNSTEIYHNVLENSKSCFYIGSTIPYKSATTSDNQISSIDWLRCRHHPQKQLPTREAADSSVCTQHKSPRVLTLNIFHEKSQETYRAER